jgi:acetolactate synthase-1/2/3 large subunit
MGKGATNPDYPYNLFTIGLQARDHVACAFEEADLIIVIGYDLVEYSPVHWNPRHDKQIIHIDFTEAEVDEYYHPQIELIADIAGTLWELNERFSGESMDKGSWAVKHRRPILEDIGEFRDDLSFPVKPQKVIHDIRQVMGMMIFSLAMSGRTRCGLPECISPARRTAA